MYKAIFDIQPENIINIQTGKVFMPFFDIYYIHSFSISINNLNYGEGIDFLNFNYPLLEINTNLIFGSTCLENDDLIKLEINYFYIKKDNYNLLEKLIDESYSDKNKTIKIISEHYINGHFSFDNGLYKNAVMNFGTVLEGLLNKDLNRTDLNDLINNSNFSQNIKSKMHNIREIRNRVHPNRISDNGDISKKDALKIKNDLEIILFEFYTIVNP